MDSIDSSKPVSVRGRTPWFSLAGILFIVLLTLGNGAANMIPGHFPTKRELARVEQDAVAEARRARIVRLLATGDHCDAQLSRELARALVYDGRSAKTYALDHERRCGADPIVERWANAPVARRKSLR
jgi:hypothetical protein